MKAKITLGIVVLDLATAFGMTALSGDPIPLCRPGVPCSADGPRSALSADANALQAAEQE